MTYPNVKALTFDLFGTVLDLGGSLTPHIGTFLQSKGASVSAEEFWQQWRYRQRLEQFQDTIMALGHSGYLETVRRAFVYTLKLNDVEASSDEVTTFLECWRELEPFPEVGEALTRLQRSYRLVALSNGDPWFLDHLVKNRIQFEFDDVISVEVVGAFKPHPGVYRRAARDSGLEVGECMMVSANSFDVVGARACGMRAAWVNRNALPYEHSPYTADVTVGDFTELANAIT
ncbi:MAG TPA: haloacid dehalogenase type II [Candidatus Latescibacteria bacterium]|nr:haloacid dehalogenase type II [Candidatus Latescibacterota bacterium]